MEDQWFFYFSHLYVLLSECVSTPKALPDSSCQREGEAKLGEAENRARHMSNMWRSWVNKVQHRAKAKSSLIPSPSFTLFPSLCLLLSCFHDPHLPLLYFSLSIFFATFGMFYLSLSNSAKKKNIVHISTTCNQSISTAVKLHVLNGNEG